MSMMTAFPRTAAVLVATAIVAAAAWPVAAQQAPTAEQMIEQLKGGAPRTRSLTRNLAVEPTAAPAPIGAPVAPEPVANPGGGQAAIPQATQAAQSGVPAVAAPVPATQSTGVAPRPSLSLLIQFDFNSAKVRAESQQSLSNLAQALQSPELRDSRFAVEGHTDASGRADLNQRLSQSRADAVRDFLAAQGVNPSRLVTAGKGSSEPANPANPLAAENRRVRIVNLE